jgi:aspartyl-tRNA synthetase
MYRSHNCGELNKENVTEEVLLAGWIQKVRDLGGLTFIDLRDRYGLIQLVFEPELEELHSRAARLHMETVIKVKGFVRARPDNMINKSMQTGEIEVVCSELEILSKADPLPFVLEEEDTASEELRLKYRYLDLRRTGKAKYIKLRNDLAKAVRNSLQEMDFLEIETPMLMKSTPEGARDYLVPSRIHPGHFYALPQSPQTYKQLLMVAGFDRYYQIVKCFRDEDLRSDRQPEFTQVDIEMSFASEEDVYKVAENVMQACFQEAWKKDLPLPLTRLTWQEAMDRFGSDKPDTRFESEIIDLAELVPDCGFGVFENTIKENGFVRGICIPGEAAGYSRKKIDALQSYARHLGGNGVVVIKWTEAGLSSQIAKFVGEEWLQKTAVKLGAQEGDLLVLAAGTFGMVCKLLGNIRLRLAKEFGLINPDAHDVLWVTNFPMFDHDEEEDRYVAAHHPFTQPDTAQLAAGVSPDDLLSRGYDLVMDGQEIAGGSVRIHEREMQKKVFDLLGITPEEAEEKFGFLLNAFKYGAPPHAGCAFGFDRLVMIFGGTDNIRDVIAFPKTNSAASPMDGSPGKVDLKQVKELHLSLNIQDKVEEN